MFLWLAAGICNSVSGDVFLHATTVPVSRLGLLIGNSWMSRLPDRDCSGCPGICANCSLHAMVGGAQSDRGNGLTKYSA